MGPEHKVLYEADLLLAPLICSNLDAVSSICMVPLYSARSSILGVSLSTAECDPKQAAITKMY